MNTDLKMLIDTNILVYTKDKEDRKRQETAINIINECIENRNGILSLQNLVEFSNVLQNKTELPSHEINEVIRDLSIDLEVIYYNNNTIIKANEYCERFRIDFFDALLAATMEENNINAIVTENTDHFSPIPWLKVINPFK